MELACIVAYIIILVGGRGVRESGWKILSALLGLVAMGQMIAMALVVSLRLHAHRVGGEILRQGQAYLYDNDKRFFVGWELDKSWVLCTVSWSVLFFDTLGLVCAATFLPKEDDYEPIPDPPR